MEAKVVCITCVLVCVQNMYVLCSNSVLEFVMTKDRNLSMALERPPHTLCGFFCFHSSLPLEGSIVEVKFFVPVLHCKLCIFQKQSSKVQALDLWYIKL